MYPIRATAGNSMIFFWCDTSTFLVNILFSVLTKLTNINCCTFRGSCNPFFLFACIHTVIAHRNCVWAFVQLFYPYWFLCDSLWILSSLELVLFFALYIEGDSGWSTSHSFFKYMSYIFGLSFRMFTFFTSSWLHNILKLSATTCISSWVS